MNTQEYISSGILEAYILGTASKEEAGILECVMIHNAEVRAAFEEAQKILEDFTTAQAIDPPAHLQAEIWEKIRDNSLINSDITEETKSIPLPIEIQNQVNNSDKKDAVGVMWNKWAVAASILLIFSVGANLYWFSEKNKTQEQLSVFTKEKTATDEKIKIINQKLEVTANPDIQKIVMSGTEAHPDAKAIVFWDKVNNKVYLNAQNLPQAPAGKQYQLWAIADGKPVSAGLYTKEKDTNTSLANVNSAQAFAITLENEGGSAVPTMENMYVLGNVL